MFIVFEGCEGSGKSTQSRLLRDFFLSQNQKTILTREPGGTPNAEGIRALFVQGDAHKWDSASELFLIMAARIDHWAGFIKPHLDAGAIVICDRFMLSTLAYQGYGRGIPLAWIKDLHAKFLPNAVPDKTFILQADPSACVKRSRARIVAESSREDRFEQCDDAFHARVARGFSELAKEYNAIVLDALLPEGDLATRIQAHFPRHCEA